MAAVLPQPPLLVPELAAGAAVETRELRRACLTAAARLHRAASRWVAVGAGPGGRRTVAAGTRGTFAGFGVDVVVALGPPDGEVEVELPLPLLIAGWAAGSRRPVPRVRGEVLAPDCAPADCRALGAALAAEAATSPDPVGLLVVGDGATSHSAQAPGHLDPRAGPFDDAVATALGTADTDALAALDLAAATDLLAVGRAPWQVLAAATGPGWTGESLHHGAPYGVGYHVAVWTPPVS